jgi:Lon protease-like protein
MVLPNATLFPKAMLPLRIFEPRYREMLAACLEEHRMFCVALLKPGVEEALSENDFYSVAGLGLVRACVGRPDGTSNLVLQGLARIRFTGFLQDHPYRIARFRELRVVPGDPLENEALVTELFAVCAALRETGISVPATLDEQLAKISDPDMLGDIIAHTFLSDAQRRQAVLEELQVTKRLRELIRHLREETASNS